MGLLRQERARQLRDLMTESGWDLLLLYGDGWRKEFVRCLVDLDYLGPYSWAGITRDGEVFLLVSDPWDEELARSESEGALAVTRALDPGDVLESLPHARSAGTIAVAALELMESRWVDALVRGCGGEPVSATHAVERLRMIKTPREIEALRRAAALADLGYQHFVDTIEEGMAEYELVAEVEAFLKAQGAQDNFMLISAGGTEVRGMKPPTERRFAPGDCVATELTPQVDGYYAQICRTLIVGEPTRAQEEAFDIYYRAQRAAQERLRPGVNISDVARAENDVFREAGLGEYTGPRYTRVRGHGLGLFVDEYPHVLEETDCVVEEGLVLIAHPNTYLPTVGYMVFGDALLVTQDGCEPLSGKTEKKLFVKT